MLELTFADKENIDSKSRNFICSKCDPQTISRRRCKEDRWDFNSNDSNIFPIRIDENGPLFGFCPGKATWDHILQMEFEELVLIAESGQLPKSGGLEKQDLQLIEDLKWFLPKYDNVKFFRRMAMIFGKSKTNNKPNNHGSPNPVRNSNNGNIRIPSRRTRN